VGAIKLNRKVPWNQARTKKRGFGGKRRRKESQVIRTGGPISGDENREKAGVSILGKRDRKIKKKRRKKTCGGEKGRANRKNIGVRKNHKNNKKHLGVCRTETQV